MSDAYFILFLVVSALVLVAIGNWWHLEDANHKTTVKAWFFMFILVSFGVLITAHPFTGSIPRAAAGWVFGQSEALSGRLQGEKGGGGSFRKGAPEPEYVEPEIRYNDQEGNLIVDELVHKIRWPSAGNYEVTLPDINVNGRKGWYWFIIEPGITDEKGVSAIGTYITSDGTSRLEVFVGKSYTNGSWRSSKIRETSRN